MEQTAGEAGDGADVDEIPIAALALSPESSTQEGDEDGGARVAEGGADITAKPPLVEGDDGGYAGWLAERHGTGEEEEDEQEAQPPLLESEGSSEPASPEERLCDFLGFEVPLELEHSYQQHCLEAGALLEERARSWEMMVEADILHKPQTLLREVRRGIAHPHRRQVWLEISQARAQREASGALYSQLVAQLDEARLLMCAAVVQRPCRTQPTLTLPVPFTAVCHGARITQVDRETMEQIEKDLPRTMPDHPGFRPDSLQGQETLDTMRMQQH